MSSFTILSIASATRLARAVRVGHHPLELGRDDLPAQAVAIDEPAALYGLAASSEERVPVSIELRLVVADHDERDRVVELVVRTGADRLEALAEEGEIDDLHRAGRSARGLARGS